jgi:tRNA A37 threonylcarbamoyladenosine biosynthesis protein TsaE
MQQSTEHKYLQEAAKIKQLHLVEWPENCLQCRRAKSNIITLAILEEVELLGSWGNEG